MTIYTKEWYERYFKKKECVICGKVFYISKNSKKKGKAVGVRGINCVTCSKECSKENTAQNIIKKKMEARNGKLRR